MKGYFEIGKIVNTHGLKGELRVWPTTDEPSRFSLLQQVEVKLGNVTQSYEIEKLRYHKQFVILKLIGIDDIANAEKLKTGVLIIPEEKALPLYENEYYIRDLLGLTVVTETGEVLGKLIKIMPTGANDVYIVKTPEGELLIPAIRQCILKVDKQADLMTVHLLEGLREL